MPTADKIATVRELTEVMKRSKGIYLADFTGLDVPSITLLRKKLRDESISFQVVKNRLALRAMQEAGIDGIQGHLRGPTGLVSTETDAALPARLLSEFAKATNGKPALKAGFVEGRVFGAAGLEALAKLPSREVLIAQVVTAIASPISGLVFTLSGLLGKFVRTLNAVAEKKRESDTGGEPSPGAPQSSGSDAGAPAEASPATEPEPAAGAADAGAVSA